MASPAHHRQQAPQERAGFTLMELMVVIVVLGILSAAIVPEMRGTYTDAVLRSGSRDLVDLCALASSRAVAFQREHRLRLDPATRRYRLEQRSRGPEGASSYLPVREMHDTEGTLDSRLTVRVESDMSDMSDMSDVSDVSDSSKETAPAPQSLTFHPDGTAERATIVLRDPQGFGLALHINPITARIRVATLDRL